MNKNNKITKFTRITFEERVIIELRYCKDSYSMAKIGKELSRPTSAISREIAGKPRKGMGKYKAYRAQKQSTVRSQKQGRKKKIDEIPKLKEYIIAKMKLGWSPEQVSIRLPIDFKSELDLRISYETIYRYVYSQVHRGGNGYLKKNAVDLRSLLPRRHKRRSTKGCRSVQKQARIDSLPSIEQRDPEVLTRTVVGHWEADTVVSRQSLQRVKTMNERVSGIYLIEKTITQDRGTENMNYQDVEKALTTKCYFAHAYSSHERGSNENCNGLLRRVFPKKTDWSKVSTEDLKYVEYLINSRPRVRLGGLTPYEKFYQLTGVALEV